MIPQRLALLGLVAATLVACSNDSGPTTTQYPPAASVRFVHATPDTGLVEIRWTDQMAGSPYYGQINYRAVTNYQAVDVTDGTRTFRVFPAGTNDLSLVTQVIYEHTLTIQEGRYYTVILHGPARAGSSGGVTVLEDPRIPPPTGQIAFKVVNTAPAGYDVHATATATTALEAANRIAANLAPLTQTPYVDRAVGTFAVRAATPESNTAVASLVAPAGAPPNSSSQSAQAGSAIGGSMLTAFIFPASVAGSGAPSQTSPTIVWMQDNRP
jgi:hypothetical protein